MMRGLFICFIALLTFCGTAHCQSACTYYPPNGFVPNAATAVSIAKAVGVPLFGADSVKAKAFTATLHKGVWTVYGHPTDGVGDEAMIKISKKTGAILETALASLGTKRTPTKS